MLTQPSSPAEQMAYNSLHEFLQASSQRVRPKAESRVNTTSHPNRTVREDPKMFRFRDTLIGGKGPLLWAGFVFLLHSAGLAFLFSPITGLFDKQPVIEQDWGLHFHHLASMEGFWRHDGQLWGYNPFFMAGYPSNTIQDLSIKLFELLALLLSALGLYPIQAFKLVVFLAMAAVPWVMYFTARNLLDGAIAAPIAALLGTAYWWNSLPREMFFYGMVGFPAASYLSVLTLSLFYRVLKSERAFSLAHVACVVALVVTLPLHFQPVLILVLPALVLFVTRWRSLNLKAVLWLGGGIFVSLLVNLVWLLPLFTHRGDDVSSSMVGQLALFLSSDPLTFLKDYLKPAGYWTFRASYWENGLRWMLLILGSMGLVQLMRNDRRDVGIMMACGVLSLFLLSYFGSLLPFFRGWQPLRFKVPYDLFLVLTSSYLVGLWREARISGLKSTLVSVLLVCGALTFLINLIHTESKNSMRLRTRVLPEVREIVEWIQVQAPKDARVLFEESGDETGFVYDGMYLSSFIPHATGRQLIGGPINLYNDRHHFAEFHSGILFKRDIVEFTDEELRAYFRVYNIGAVVAFHPRSVQRLLSVPELVSLDRRIGAIHLMKLNQPLDWFLKGKGGIETGWNLVHGFNIRGDEVILKYHWTKGLVSNPPARIEPVKILDDPIPFIKIINPPSEFTLRIGK